MANLFLSDSISSLEDYFIGDPIAQANKLIADKLQQSLEFAFNKNPTNAVGNLVVTSTSVQYTLAPGSVAPAGVKIVINGSGFPSGTTTLSSLGADTDYSISSVTVIVDSVAGTNFANPVSTVTLNTNISVVASRMKTFGINGFTIAAGDVNVALTGTLTTALGTDSSGNVTLKTASFSNAGLSITYDTDPSSTATKLAQLYLKGSFGLDSANMSDPLTSATITDFGFKTFAGTNVTASPVHYFYGENLNITLSKLESVADNATAADLLRAVFDGTSDTVFTSASVEIPEGFEKIEIQGTGGTSVTANGLNNFIKGSTGNDTVDGASGVDTFTTQGTFAQSTGVLNQDGSVSLTAKGGGIDRIANIENIQFSDKSVSISQTIDSAEITYTVVGNSKVVNLLPLNNSSGFLTQPDYKILGRDGQVVLSNNGDYFAQSLSDLMQVTNARTGQITNIPLQGARPYGNYTPVAVSNDGEDVFFVTWNNFNLSNQGYGGLYKYHIDVNNSGEGTSFKRLDTNLSGEVLSSQGYVDEHMDAAPVDVSSNGRYAAFTLLDAINQNDWMSGQKRNIYVKDSVTDQITKIDSSNINGFSWSPKISDDGRYILFESNAELTQRDIADGVEQYWSNDLFMYDLLNHTTTRINEGQDGTRFDTGGYGWSADMSADGKIVTFTAGGTYERQGGTPDGLIDPNGGTPDVYVKNLSTGVIKRISDDQNGGSESHISPDGIFVSYRPYFYSNAIQQEIINLESGEKYYAPGVPISSTAQYTGEAVITLGNNAGILGTNNSYPGDEDGGDSDYIFFRYGQTEYSLSTLDGSALPGWVSLDTDGGIPKLIVSDAPSSEFGHHYFVLTAMGSTPVSQTFDLLLKQNTLPTGSVTLSGTATQGQTLTAVNNLADVDGLGAISYTWKANGVTVGSGSSYTLTQQEVGKSITATATYFDGDGTAESATSASKGSVVNINDLPTGSVLINGVAKEGKNLTATNTIVDADGLGTISYTWKANGTSIGTGTSYTLKQSEVGKSISLSASYVDGFGKSEQIESAATNSVTSINSPDAALYLSDSITDLEQYFVGDPIAQANKLLADKLQQSLEFAFNKTPTNAIGNLVVTSTSVQYTLAPGSAAPAGVKIVINGSGFPSGATTMSALGTDTDYSISSISVIVDSVAGTNFTSPVSTVTLNTNINVASSRMTAFGLNGFSIAAGDVNIALSGTLSTALGIDASGSVTLKNANFSNAALSITYDTDPSSTATKLAQLYLKGSFGLDSANMSDPLVSATITDFGFKTFAGTNVTASPVHYFYGENLNITLSKLESVSDNATAADLLRAVFDGTSDTVFTSASVEIPEGFEKVEIQSTGGTNVTANGLNNFIKGSNGNDTVDGATGNDIFTTQGTFARSTGVLNQDGSVSLTTKGGGVDRIANIENVQFSDKAVSITQTIDSAEINYSVNRLSGVSITLPEIKVGDGVVNFSSQSNDWWGNEEKGLILTSGKWLTARNVKIGDYSYNIEVARFNADGSPDKTFGTGGVTSISGFANSLSLAESINGEVILSQSDPGYFGATGGPKLWKITSGGVVLDSLSNTLSSYGTSSNIEVDKLITDGQGGFFAIGGSSESWNQGETKVFKFTSDGVLDSSFGNGTGIFSRDVSGTSLNRTQDAVKDSFGRLYILSDGNYDNGVYLTRITASGEIDEGFGTKILGLGTTNNPLGLALDSNGNVLVAFYKSYSSIQIARIHPDGSFDTNFGGGDGIAAITLKSGYSWTPSGAQLLSVDAQNRPVLAFQNSGNTEIIRITANGTLDKIFTSNGDFASGTWESPRWVQIDTLGNVLVGVTDQIWNGESSTYYSVVKFTESGLLDKKFDENTSLPNYYLTNYDGSALPQGVLFNSETRELSVNENAATGNYFLTVIASRGELSDSKSFVLNIKQDFQLLGGVGKDRLFGEEGNDTLSGGEGRDYLNGGEGNDYLDGGSGIDLLMGGAGDDIYVVDTLRDVIIDQSGWDTIKSENLNEINLQRYRGIEAAEYTGTGSVTLIGSYSNNLLIGSSGSDNLTGKFGNDILTGGDSADSFVFNAKLDAQFNFDLITDFSTGADKLVLDKTIFTRFTNAVQDGNLVMDMDAQDGDDYLIYDSNTQTLYYDADGSAFGAKVAFVQVVGINSLSSADFSVI